MPNAEELADEGDVEGVMQAFGFRQFNPDGTVRGVREAAHDALAAMHASGYEHCEEEIHESVDEQNARFHRIDLLSSALANFDVLVSRITSNANAQYSQSWSAGV